MKIILVTLSDILPYAFEKILNLENEYCAIVVDEPDEARKFFSLQLPKNFIHPLYDLKDIVSDLNYDCLLCISDYRITWIIPKFFKYCGVPDNKLVHLCITDDANSCFNVEQNLKYFEVHSGEFDMFATGMSYTKFALDANHFKNRLFNFAIISQDLYFDYQIAKFAISGGGKVRFALIGLAPYTFHYDQSKTQAESWRLMSYLIALNDLHNFWLDENEYKKLFHQEIFNAKIPVENFNPNLPDKMQLQKMDTISKLAALERAEIWNKKFFPETVEENKKIFDDYLTLCEENNILPIVFIPPCSKGYVKHFSKEKLAEFNEIIQNALKRHPKMIYVESFEWNGVADEDFFDIDHLNIHGAEKFSKELNSIIEEVEKNKKIFVLDNSVS